MEYSGAERSVFGVVKCSSGRAVWPAAGTGSKCADPAAAPALGTRFQLALSDAQIEALGVPAWKRTILRAMARYGVIVGDTGGSGFNLQFESGTSYTSFGYEDPMVAFARRNDVPRYQGKYVFNLRDGIDWQRHLRVVESN